MNVTDENRPLVSSALVAALRATGPYPILKTIGEQGTAKSTLFKVFRGLIDPNTAPIRRPPRSERDLMIAANNAWVVAYDNLSYLPTDLSDALSVLATGGGIATRTNYTDDEETLFNATSPILLNAI